MDPNLSISSCLIFVGLSVALFLLFPPSWTGPSKRSGVQLSRNARWILAGLSVSLLLLLFPPFWYGNQYGIGTRQWHFVLDSRLTTWDGGRAPREGAVDLLMLFLELFVVGVGMGAAWYLSTSLQGQDEA
jgi:hypothetical protein